MTAETLPDPIDGVAAGGGWTCSICSVDQPISATYCQMCLYSRPMDRRGVPQIFAGYAIHFNGIIPRTVIHPSHSVEWRMAERHGAVCIAKFDHTTTNILVYRPGYERSEKCRACLEKYTNIPSVPITWMLDSLLQSRQVHPSLYRLTSIPAVANPTVRGADLPHHQHPFYMLNKMDYAIPTSFPPEKKGSAAAALKGAHGKGISAKDMDIPAGMDISIPPFFDIDAPQFANVHVYDAAVKCAGGKGAKGQDGDDDEIEARKTGAGIELIASQQSSNRIDKMLFSGFAMLLSPTLASQKNAVQALQACGAKIVKPSGAGVDACIRSEATHIVYHPQDKKSDLMIAAARLAASELPGLQLAQSNWVEDCLMLGEVLPLYGMYAPTPKLLETLGKKYDKRN